MIAFMQRHQNAKVCIAQIKREKWSPKFNPISRKYLTAYMGDLELWMGNGPAYLDISKQNYFGIFRYWVWYAAAKKLTQAEKPIYNVPVLSDFSDKS